jgi:hypothetical protein
MLLPFFYHARPGALALLAHHRENGMIWQKDKVADFTSGSHNG